MTQTQETKTMTQAEITKAILSSRHAARTKVEKTFRAISPDLADCWHAEQPNEPVGVIRAAVEAGEDYEAVAYSALADTARSWCDEVASECDGPTQTKIAAAKAAL
jgi:hypothetical protein